MLAPFWRLFTLGIIVSLGLAGASCATASDTAIARCADCNSKGCCQKTCRLVQEEKKVSVTCWGCQCEDFCLPGPSDRSCLNCEVACSQCDPEIQTARKTFSWYQWIPGCPKGIATKKKLMKKTVTQSVPSFKWVVVDLCPNCAKEYVPPEVPAGTKLPPPPTASGKVPGAPRQ